MPRRVKKISSHLISPHFAYKISCVLAAWNWNEASQIRGEVTLCVHFWGLNMAKLLFTGKPCHKQMLERGFSKIFPFHRGNLAMKTKSSDVSLHFTKEIFFRYCWTSCITGWCYSNGEFKHSQNYRYVACEGSDHHACCYGWSCAGSCTL